MNARAAGRAGVAATLVCLGAAQAEVTEEHAQRPYPVRAQPGETVRQVLNAATPIAAWNSDSTRG